MECARGVEDGVRGERMRGRGGEGEGEAGEEGGRDGVGDTGGDSRAISEAVESVRGLGMQGKPVSDSQLVLATELGAIDGMHQKAIQEVRNIRHGVVPRL
jgi:hypothetical protein